MKSLLKTCSQQGSTSNIEKVPPPASSSKKEEQGNFLPQLYFDQTLKNFAVIPSEDTATYYSSSSINESTSPAKTFLYQNSPSSPDVFVPPRLASAPSTHTGVKRNAESVQESFFTKKRNTKATGAYLMEEAVKVMKNISVQPPPTIDLGAPDDREEIFGNYVASRLRMMADTNKKQCKSAIMAVLMDY